ncbi:hypothetical protein ARALYDRAFT_896273 [Arabidopsis lyrata subsp. lyrata]|uniref:WEB family protein n=1 Tax=Arabidopsis lyrata subsp. lyrata TaxID=81972 RepID=D7L0B0_ARALL|nr:hypothetical protein ARALYDRAFT_896273 [Arabidopsis lyrata subsp. lyrata]
MASKIKTGLSETTLGKSCPASLRVPRLTRIVTKPESTSPSPTQQQSRLSFERSSSNSKPSTDKRSPKARTPPEKTQIRAVKGSETQPRSVQIKEDLRKANELIASLENEKAKALDQLKEARKEAEEASDKLVEALNAQKKAQENFEIEKFEVVEAGIEAVQRKEEELKKELENVKNQHASESATLLLVTRELENVNQELAYANDAKSKALSHADDASNLVAVHAEKVEILSSELMRLKALLDSTREKETISKNEIASKLGAEIVDLKRDLEKATSLEAKVKELEMIIEQLNVDLEAAKMAGSYAKELESSKEEEEKIKKAMESLASAMHEVSSDSRELKEKLLSQGDQDYETQIEDLKLVIKATNKKYENMLDEARHEIDVLVNAVEQTKKQFESAMVDWEMREAGLVNHVKEFDEEVSSMVKEMNRLGNLVKRTKEEADASWEKESQMRDSLKEVEDEVIYLQETLREAKAETLKLKGKMLDKETEFQSIVHENDELRVKQDDSLKKIKELSELLEEALAKKHTEENGELSESEKEYDLLPKVVEFSEENGYRNAEEKSSKVKTLDGMNMKLEEDSEKKEKKEHSPDDETVEVEFKMWESCQIEKKEVFHKGKPEQEFAKEEEEDLNVIDQSEKTSPVNGLTGEDELVKEQEKKKKKTLFGKVGNLLKKKGPVNQK